MTQEQLVDYIKKATEHGMSKDEIRANLTNSGWDASHIDAGFAQAEGAPTVPAAPSALSGDADPLPSAVAMWKRAWGIFRKRTGLYLGIAAVPAVVSAVFQTYLTAYPYAYGWFFLAFLAAIIVQALAALAYIYAAHGEADDMGKAYGLAFKKFWRLVWLGIISSIVVGGLTCLLFVPGIIAGGWFLFSVYVLALEDKGGMNAMFTSREYVRGKWWVAVGYTILPAFIVGIIAAIANGILGAIKVPYYDSIVSLVVVFLFAPTVAIYNYLVYAGLKKLKGTVAPKITTGRKAKYVVLALAGFIVPLVIMASSMVMLFSVFKNMDKSKLPVNGAALNVNSSQPSSEELDRLMQQFKNLNVNVNVPAAGQ